MVAVTRRVLGRLGLLPYAANVKRRVDGGVRRTIADVRWRVIESAPDRLPVPPPTLRRLVAGTDDLEWFIGTGKRESDAIIAFLTKNGVDLQDVGAMLDFGCGCGRVVRHWCGLAGVRVHGSDYNPKLVAWAERNLGFATFAVNGLRPPLSYAADTFGFVYAISVFTHMPEDLQGEWVAELARVLRPGGHLLITTHGDPHADHALAPPELAAFRRGEVVVRDSAGAGSNACATFNPQSSVRALVASLFDVCDFVPGGPVTQSDLYTQDMWLLRLPAEARPHGRELDADRQRLMPRHGDRVGRGGEARELAGHD